MIDFIYDVTLVLACVAIIMTILFMIIDRVLFKPRDASFFQWLGGAAAATLVFDIFD